MYKIAVIGGDGTGPEVTREAVKVLARGRQALRASSYETHATSTSAATATCAPARCCPSRAVDELRGFDAILLGAIGHPDVKPGILEKGILLRLRFELDQYINLRPVKLYPGRRDPAQGQGPERHRLRRRAREHRRPLRRRRRLR